MSTQTAYLIIAICFVFIALLLGILLEHRKRMRWFYSNHYQLPRVDDYKPGRSGRINRSVSSKSKYKLTGYEKN